MADDPLDKFEAIGRKVLKGEKDEETAPAITSGAPDPLAPFEATGKAVLAATPAVTPPPPSTEVPVNPWSQQPADPAAMAVTPEQIANPRPQGLGLGTLEEARNYLEPDPNLEYGATSPAIPGAPVGGIGMFSPFAHNRQTGEVTVTLPPAVRGPLLGALDVLQGRVAFDPEQGGVVPTPNELALFGGVMGRPLRGGPVEAAPAALATREAPLSPSFQAAPIAPGAATRAAQTPPGEPVPPAPRTGPVTPFHPAAPSETPPSSPNPYVAGVTTTVTETPATIDAAMTAAKTAANQHYATAKANGASSFTPESVGKMVDAVDAAAPQGPGEKAVGGDNAITRLQREMQPLRGQSLDLTDIQRMDELMTDNITAELRAGRNKVAGQLKDIQQAWRQQVDAATPNDVTGSVAGFQALQPARQAWTQYRKLDDVVSMKERADMTQNPTTSYRTAVKNFITSNASRGWTDDEIAALKDSAERGVIGDALHTLGSRLLPHVGGAVGASVGGIPGFLVGEATTHAMGAGARNLANALQTARVNLLGGVLSRGVPSAAPAPSAAMLPGPRAIPPNLLLPPVLTRRDQDQPLQ